MAASVAASVLACVVAPSALLRAAARRRPTHPRRRWLRGFTGESALTASEPRRPLSDPRTTTLQSASDVEATPYVGASAANTSLKKGRVQKWIEGPSLAYALLIGAYVLNDTLVYVVGDLTTTGHNRESVAVVSALISVLAGLLWTGAAHGRRDVGNCVSVQNVVKLLPVSLCFGVSVISQLHAQTAPGMSGAFIKVLGQFKLPLTALLSFFFFHHRYSYKQQLFLLLLFVSCCAFSVLSFGSASAAGSGLMGAGVLFSMLWVAFNVVGTLMTERTFKDAQGLPFSVQMTNLRMGELCVALAVMWYKAGTVNIVPGFFSGWDVSVFLNMLTHVLDSLLSGLMVKMLSAVNKSVSKCLTLVALLGYYRISGKGILSPLLALAAFMIVFSSACFARVSVQLGQHRLQRHRSAPA